MSQILNGIVSRLWGNSVRVFFFRLFGCRIGRNVDIGRHTRIYSNVEVADNVKIGSRVKVFQSVLGEGVLIEENVKMHYVRIGKGSIVKSGAIVYGTSENWIEIGTNVVIGNYWVLDGIGGLVIEDYVDTASPAGSIFTHSSFKKRLMGHPIGLENLEKAPVHIGSCTWIGANVTIQPGVRIGDHCAVMANSTVIKDVEPYTMVSGVPADILKRIVIEKSEVTFIDIIEQDCSEITDVVKDSD